MQILIFSIKEVYMNRKPFLIVVMSLSLILFSLIGFYIKYNSNPSSKVNNFMTIMVNNINMISYYYKYDIETNKFKEVYHKKNNNYTDGEITKDGNTLYYTDKDSNNKYNLYKTNINNSSHTNQQVTKGIKIDMFCIGDNRIYCRAAQWGHGNYGVAIVNLSNNKLTLLNNKEDFDTDVYNFQYNQYTHKLYTIERSEKELQTIHLPNMPTSKIIEYTENGKKIKELFKIKGYIHNISVSKDGSTALISVTIEPTLDKIFLVNLKNLNKKLLLESSRDYAVSKAIFSADEKGFYLLAITPDSKVIDSSPQHIVRSRGIYYYNFTTQKTSKVFSISDSFVNDFNIQY